MNELILDHDPDSLIHFLHFHGFAYLDQHEKLAQYAHIFKHKRNGNVIGYTWMYELHDEPFCYNVHMCMDKRFHGQIFNKRLVNQFYSECYNLGAKVLDVGPAPKHLIQLYNRIGFENIDAETARLKLPFQWRNKWDQQKK